MADSITTFIAKTARMENELRNLERNSVRVAAAAVKTSVLAELAAAGAATGRLRGVGRKGARVGVTYTIAEKTALVRATGPFQLIERDTRAHRIPKERGSRARKRVVVIPGVGVRAFAEHPGTKGKHPWEKGVLAAVPIQEKAQQIALGQALARAYR
jgi:hypothetical protein